MIPFPHYGDFTAFTPVVPELYWNVYSAEERIKALCMEWVKLTAYTDALADTVNEQYSDLKADIQARYDALDEAVDNIDDIVTQMQSQFPQLVNEQVNLEIRRLINSGEFQEILQEAIDEYWTEYGQRISGVESGLQTLNSDLATERTARITEDADIRSDIAADIASLNATISADIDRLDSQDESIWKFVDNQNAHRITDWNLFATFPNPPSYYANSIAYDSTTDCLFIAFYSGTNSNCILRKYENVSTHEYGTALTHTQEVTYANNHSNSMSFYDGKAYASEWNRRNISVIDCSNMTFVEQLNAELNLRTAYIDGNRAILQPYNGNMLYVLIWHEQHPLDLDYAIGYKVTIPSQYQYVQDCTIHNNGYYRLLSKKGGYVEVIPISLSTSPLLIPFNIENETGEFEGITFLNNKCLVTTGNKIYVSESQLSNVVPQVNQSLAWTMSDSQYATKGGARQSNGLMYEMVEGNYAHSLFKIPIPKAIWDGTQIAGADMPRLLIDMQSVKVGTGTANYGPVAFELPLKPLQNETTRSTMIGIPTFEGFTLFNVYWQAYTTSTDCCYRVRIGKLFSMNPQGQMSVYDPESSEDATKWSWGTVKIWLER